jgi:hypothetical protein
MFTGYISMLRVAVIITVQLVSESWSVRVMWGVEEPFLTVT